MSISSKVVIVHLFFRRVRRDRGPPRGAPPLWQIREICEECEAFSTQSCSNLQLCGGRCKSNFCFFWLGDFCIFIFVIHYYQFYSGSCVYRLVGLV